jgi:hypothetical protein
VVCPLSQWRRRSCAKRWRKAISPADEAEQRAVGGAPVQPGQGIVLTIGVVVAGLRAADFVTALQHRHPLRDEQRGEQRALQATTAFSRTAGSLALAFLAAVCTSRLWFCPSRLSSPLSSLCLC